MLIICEETPGMPGPVMTAFQNTCTGDNNIILAVGNPDSELDELHQFCELPNVKHFKVSAYDYPNVVLDKELMPGAVTRKSIKRREDKYGKDSAMYNSRVRGISPAQSEDSLIKLDWINQCIDLDVELDELESTYLYNAVGVDVANSESGDKAALAWGVGEVLDLIQEFQCDNATHLAYNIMYDEQELTRRGYKSYNTKTANEYSILPEFIGVDAVGVGVATINAFDEYGWTVKGLQGPQWDEAIPKEEIWKDGKKIVKPLYKFASLRAQMYWELREDLRRKKICIAIEDKEILLALKKELVTPKFDLRANTVAVEKKEDIKKRLGGKSPNMADAVVYWNWVRKGYQKEVG